jgi:hypothetical protein
LITALGERSEEAEPQSVDSRAAKTRRTKRRIKGLKGWYELNKGKVY